MRQPAARRTVFVDHTALDALADPFHTEHEHVLAQFERLLAEFERGDAILVTHAGMAARAANGSGSSTLTAVCDVEPLRRWLVRRAERAMADHPELALDLDQAAALVLMERRGIDEVLTIDPLYDVIDVDVLTR